MNIFWKIEYLKSNFSIFLDKSLIKKKDLTFNIHALNLKKIKIIKEDPEESSLNPKLASLYFSKIICETVRYDCLHGLLLKLKFSTLIKIVLFDRK